MGRLRVGIDLVQVSRIAGSVDAFGDRFLNKIYTAGEIEYAGRQADRLAVRFAAKEATKKALELEIGWHDVEVVRRPSGACDLKLHGAARREQQRLGAELALSMSHEGDYATAVVVAQWELS